MIRYGYNRQVSPAGPFVHVAVHRPDGTGESPEWPAQLDTGADMTVISERSVADLKLTRYRDLVIAGFGGTAVSMTTYLIQLTIRQFPPLVVEALTRPEDTYILLGRDVLNNYRIVLDGPQLAVEID